MNYKDELDKILSDDPEGLLVVNPKASNALSADERLVASFQEINDFVKENGKEPQLGGNIKETMLYQRLKGMRENQEKSSALQGYDEHKLLDIKLKEINSIDDIFNDDSGILDSDAESIFNIKFVPKETTLPEYVARRKSCKDFENFSKLFVQCQFDLKNGKRILLPFEKDYEMKKGMFFVLKGVLVYLDEVGEKKKDKHGKWDTRLRAIFENGTESDLLLRSLGKELYKDGRRVTEHEERLLDGFSNITEEDKETGYIYILRSMSTKEEIKSIENLYKIGFSRVPVEERIKNALNEPTYLMSPVSIIAVYRCFNINPQKFEQLLHQFFGRACLNVDIYGNDKKRYTPREWFVAPLNIIEQAIHFVMSGEIIKYKYDEDKKFIIPRE